jgi:hypothetical protein
MIFTIRKSKLNKKIEERVIIKYNLSSLDKGFLYVVIFMRRHKRETMVEISTNLLSSRNIFIIMRIIKMEKKQGAFGSVMVDPKKKIVKRRAKFGILNPLVLKAEEFIQNDFRSVFDPKQKITKRLLNLKDKKKKESIYGYAGPTVLDSVLIQKKYPWKKIKHALLQFIETTLDLCDKQKMVYGDLHYNNICFDGKRFYFIDNSSWMTNYSFIKSNIFGEFIPEVWENPYKFVKPNKRIIKKLEKEFDIYKKTLRYYTGYTDPSKIMYILLGKLLYDVYNETSKEKDPDTEKIIIGLMEPDPSKREFLYSKKNHK